MYRVYRFVRTCFRTAFHLSNGLDVTGADNLPASGGTIIASNHRSLLDPLIVGCAVSRPVHFMAKEELFHYPGARWLLSSILAFPVTRGQADRAAIRRAVELLQAGSVLGLFPEGTRNQQQDDTMLPLQGGTAMLALKLNVPVVPVVVQGTKPYRFRKPIEVYVGPPIVFPQQRRPGKTDIQEASAVILEQFGNLLRRKT